MKSRAESFALTLAFALALPLSASAVETQLSADGRYNLDQLRASGAIQVATDNDGNTYTVDTSAVLSVVPARFMAASTDFDHQRQLGMPDIAEAHVVARNGDQLYAWVHMSATGTDSKHYLEVRNLSGLSPSSALGEQWEMVPNNGWSYENSPAFGRIEGSLYLLPLGSGDPNQKQPTYIRYFSVAEVQTILPSFLISHFVRGQLSADIQRGLRIIAAQAQ